MEKIKVLNPEELGEQTGMTATEIKSAIENDTIVYVYCWDDSQQGYVLYYPDYYDEDTTSYLFYDLLNTSVNYRVENDGVFVVDANDLVI